MDATVTTVGTAEVSATPDAVRVQLAVTSTADTVSGALAANATALAAAVDVARQHTDPEKVRSTSMNVWSNRQFEHGPLMHTVNHGLLVQVASLDAAGDLVDALAARLEGSLQVDGVHPQVSDPEEHLAEARRAAFQDAQAKAVELAGLAGRELGAVVTVIEGAGGWQPHPREVVFTAARTDSAKTRFEPGQQSMSSSVTVTWSLL